MPNPNPHKARQARHKARKPGDLNQLKLKLWNAILCAEEILDRATKDANNELGLRSIHAIVQASGTFARLIETGELEARVATLESQVQRRSAA
jgi:hypothetical protein